MYGVFLARRDDTSVLGEHVLTTGTLLPANGEMNLWLVVENGDVLAVGLGRVVELGFKTEERAEVLQEIPGGKSGSGRAVHGTKTH
jgi:hypothetical protein